MKTRKNDGGAVGSFASLLRTSCLFGGFMLVFHVVLWVAVPVWKQTDPLRQFTTKTVSFLLVHLNIPNVVAGNSIALRNDTWIVTLECTAVNAMILFVSFVLAYASSIRAKLLALATGIPFLIVANLARLVTLGLLTEYFPSTAHFFHDLVWQTVFVFLVVAMWLVWIDLVVKHEGNPAVSK